MVPNFVISFVFEKSLKTFRKSNELTERKHACIQPMGIDGNYNKSADGLWACAAEVTQKKNEWT